MKAAKKVRRCHEKGTGWMKRIGLFLDKRCLHCNTIDSHPWSAKQEVLRRLNVTEKGTRD